MVVSAFWSGNICKASCEWSLTASAQGLEAGMFALSAQPSIAAQAHFGKARHALDVQMQQVARSRVLIAHDGDGGRAGRAIGSAGRGPAATRLTEAEESPQRRAIW